MNRSFLALLQLIRLPNVLTAAADSLAGWLLVGGSLRDLSRWLPLSIASMLLYMAGMALNDVFDAEEDRRDRPNRPIPSGRVSRSTAGWLGWVGLLVGPFVAAASGSRTSAIVAAALALAILAYDAGAKRTPLGPWVMGLCRGLNLLLGTTHAASLGGPPAWLAATAFGLFVSGITWVSRSETETGRTRNLWLGLIVQNLAILGLIGVAFRFAGLLDGSSLSPIVPVAGALILALVAFVVNLAGSRAIKTPVPPLIQKTVKTGILSLVWIDVGLVASAQGFGPALAVAALWLPAYFLGRWLYST